MNDIKLIDLGNVGDLATPATVLIEKVSQALGTPFVPWQMKRIAKAEVEVDLIQAKGDIEKKQLQERAINRFIAEESRKQANIESIVQKAIPNLKKSARPKEINDDWLFNFFEKSKAISDEQMQLLWSRILSGEANSPGSFSRRTVNFLEDVSQYDAAFFAKLCSFFWNDGTAFPMIYDPMDQIYQTNGISFSAIKHLDDIGLISFDSLAGYQKQNLPEVVSWRYFDKKFTLTFSSEKNKIQVGKVILSKIGMELANICNPTPIDGFIEYVLNKLDQQKIQVTSIR